MPTHAYKRLTATESSQTVASVEACSGVTGILSALRVIQSVAPSTSLSWQRKLAHDELYAVAKTSTPYGLICQESTIVGLSCELLIYHVCPFAFLQHACDKSGLFYNFLAYVVSQAQNGLVDVIVYLDNAKPNEKRADNGRACQCIYWSLLQFPDWFRSRRCGWLPFAYILCDDQKGAGISDGMLLTFFVKCVDSSEADVSFGNGFGVGNSSGSVCIIKSRGFLSVADWEQHVKSFSLKGPSGSIPCNICTNCCGRCDYFSDDPLLVHLHSPDVNKFQLHTAQSFRAQADRLKRVAEHEPASLKLEEQAMGLKYNPHEIMWDIEVRLKIAPPYSMYGDWMHTWCASGGLAQYEVNGMVMKLVSDGLDLSDLDAMSRQIKLPKGMTRLKPRFFQERVSTSGRLRSHLRAFASETLTAVMVLGFIIDLTIRENASDELQRYILCFDLLRIILCILQRGDINELATFKDAMQTHHNEYMMLYHRIPKLHAAHHVVHMWRYWGSLLSCFGPERHHLLMKRVLRFAYKNCTKSILAYDVRQWMKHVRDQNVFRPFHLVGKLHDTDVEVMLTTSGAVYRFLSWAGCLNSLSGLLSKGDVLQYKVNGSTFLGLALGFGKTSAAEPFTYAAFVRPCSLVARSRFAPQAEAVSIVWVGALIGSVPFVLNPDNTMDVLLHAA